MDKQLLQDSLQQMGIPIDDTQTQMFNDYLDILLEWNENVNLTAITDKHDIVIKHFVDSASLLTAYDIKDMDRVIDVGCGAGFPSLPLKILRPNTYFTLADSLNKRIKFLDDVIDKLQLTKIDAVHGRSEELGQNKQYRETYDVAVARAVANLPVLCEYCLPFVKVGGKFVALKGPNYKDELDKSEKAINKLGGKLNTVKEVKLPNSDITHYILIIDKISKTPKQYPRKAGTATKTPII